MRVWLNLARLVAYRATIGVSAAALALTIPARAQVLRVTELNAAQIRALDRARTVVILPNAILEEHGPYLPSYSDGYGVERLTEDLAKAMAATPGWSVLVFPVIPLGSGAANVIGGKWTFPGSYTVRTQTVRAVFMDLATELGEQDFRWVFVVNAHGAPHHHRALDQAGDFFHDRYRGEMVNLAISCVLPRSLTRR